MKLKPIDTPEIPLIAQWMSKKENYQWLDFGSGNQILSAMSLKIMTQRDIHLLRVFTSDAENVPIGLVALSNIARNFKTATLWYVLGDKGYSAQGYTTHAVFKILVLGFVELGLQAVNAWTLEHNAPSIRVLEHNNFQLIGRQRKCHYIDGISYDRLLFDLFASEHRRLNMPGEVKMRRKDVGDRHE